MRDKPVGIVGWTGAGNGTKTNEQDAVQQLWIMPEPSTQLMAISVESELNDEAISMLMLGEPQ